METDRLKYLLNAISKIVAKNKVQQEEKRKRGENFNIFSVMGLQTKEVRLHSAFLAELLNPKGNHGLGDKFLVAFLEKKLNSNSSIDTDSVNVSKEYYIGSIDEDGKRGGQIDILILDDKKNAIIIENKIDAVDQKYQLLRYHNHAEDNNLKYVLVYLTKEGKDANEVSTGGVKFDYKRISYQEDIIPWLEYCEQIAVRFPLVRETIHQYIINLKEILNIMDELNEEALLEIMLEKDNAYAITEILSRQGQWFGKILEKYIWSPLELYCKEKDNEFELQHVDDGISIKKKSWNNAYISIGTEKKYTWNEMFIGITCVKEEKPKKKMSFFEEEPNGWWPYGSTYLPSELSNWEDNDTRKKIINGDVVEYLKKFIGRILNEIEKESIVL